MTPLGYTQTLYEFTTAAANNGSDYFGASADTPFWNWSTGIIVFLGRYAPIGLMLAIAGSFTIKERKEVIEPIKTKGLTFVSVVVVVTFLLDCFGILSILDHRTIFNVIEMKNKMTAMWNLVENKIKNSKSQKEFFAGLNRKVIYESVTRLNPRYLAKYNPVMFTVEVGFFLVLFIALFPFVSSEFVDSKPNILFWNCCYSNRNCLVCYFFRVFV